MSYNFIFVFFTINLFIAKYIPYYFDIGFDSLGILSYNRSLRSKNTDINTKKSNYRELSDYFFKKGIFIKSGAYLDSLIQLLEKKSFIKKMTERERRGLDRIINL